MADELRHVYLNPKQIRVLAHPLRSRLIGELRLDGPATATRLAEALGTNTGATSYHLRQLAEAGLVREDPGAGHGRERVWQAAHDVSSWQRNAYADDPDATAAADWLAGYQVKRFADRAEHWQRALADEPAAWRDAASFSDYILTLTAGQLDGMLKELDAVVERHRRNANADPAPDGRQVLIYLAGLPRVGPS
jgi:predicted ArsR family transcriptional regulator